MPTTESFQPVQFGNYLLVSQIGRGGMAEVFKARARGAAGFERVVCVKRVLRSFCEDQHFLDMFINEAKVSARLAHPSIVQVYELGEVDGEFFMAMEFVNGRDVLRVMKAHGDVGPLPPVVSAYIARDMCRALAYAHEWSDDSGVRYPIIHRDVSPQNVMVSFDGVVKLCDFGIAKAANVVGEQTRAGALKGKFAYMAPEQLDGQKASPLTDIFSVGVTLHEMLTGRRLFKGNTDYETLVRVKTQPVPPPSTLNDRVPADLDRIVNTSLARDPSQRYQRGAQMARDLEQFCARANFTSEEMKEFMVGLFPNREELPDGVVSVPSQSTSATTGSRPRQKTGVGPPPSQKSGKAKYALIGGAGALVAGGLALVFVLKGGSSTAERPPSSAAAVTTPLAPGAPPAPQPKATAEVQEVLLDSNPSGTEVTDGPRLLGVTPLKIRLTDKRPSLTVRLAKNGYDELSYELTANDVPQIVLKMNPRKSSSSGRHSDSRRPAPTAPTTPTNEPNRPPKVQTFDEVESGVKVKTVDD